MNSLNLNSVPLEMLVVTFIIVCAGFIFIVSGLVGLSLLTDWSVQHYKKYLKASEYRARFDAIYQFVPVADIVRLIEQFDLITVGDINKKEAMVRHCSGKVLTKWLNTTTRRIYIKYIDRDILRHMCQNAFREALMRDTKENIKRAGLQVSNRQNKSFTLSPDTIIVDGMLMYNNLVLGANYNIAFQQARRAAN
jgi:hypothetical protein